MTQKTTVNCDRIVSRDDCLKELYPQSPQSPADLWLERHCIHPERGKVRTLWAQASSAKQTATMLKQVDRLNREGFGIYFVPVYGTGMRRAVQALS